MRERSKKLRSLLRLVLPLRDDGFPSEMRLLGDAGRPLAALSDADADRHGSGSMARPSCWLG